MFATLRSVSRMKRALRKSDRGNGPRLSIAVEIEEEEDYMSTFMWYGVQNHLILRLKFSNKALDFLDSTAATTTLFVCHNHITACPCRKHANKVTYENKYKIIPIITH